MFNDEEEEILKELKSQWVSHVGRISVWRNGDFHKTKHLILTFVFPKLREYIKAGYMRLPVRPYIPSSLRCFKCQRFGHSKTSCRGRLTCARCADVGHDSSQCNSVEKCVNCKGAHTSYSRNCPTWLLEKEVISTKIKNQISFTEARKLVKSQTPTGTSYASKAQTKAKQSKSFNILNDSLALVKSAAIPDIQSNSNSTKLSITQNESVSVRACDVASASQDSADFQLVTKKKKYKKSLKTAVENQKESMSEKSKFWVTSPMQVPTSATMEVNKSASTHVANHSKAVHKTDYSPASTISEHISIAANCNNKSDNDIGSSVAEDAIDYDPNETIEETSPVIDLQEQPTVIFKTPTSTDNLTFKEKLKNSPFHWVNFKTFHPKTVSTTVHDKYSKKYRVKRL
ncbi:uncharacterized protein LOC129956742 [Argiope bruennichi]|uniref:uncharacterized protein LOC129956742 n=1 Tax=Argiope bruennichi TaxID=94029 RepID=UPI00249461BF|nr:uncharacterized protein LOC129956742 [Argiope bruennichi]